LMEEGEVASVAAETNGFADEEDTEMSPPEINGVNHLDQVQTPKVCRHTKRLSAEPCLIVTRNHSTPSSSNRPSRQVLRLRRRVRLLLRPCHRLYSEQVRVRLDSRLSGRSGERLTVQDRLTLTVQDENMKNIMMSWYYAGYYTGLHAGQQQAPKTTTTSPKQ
jgi:hypothetical protein